MRSLSSKASGCIFPRKLLATPSVSPQVQKNHSFKVFDKDKKMFRKIQKNSVASPKDFLKSAYFHLKFTDENH
jgi:hypothetical protein